MSTSHWTIADLAEMTQLASQMIHTYYCVHCTVVPVKVDGDLCEGCTEEICSYLQDDEERYYDRLADEDNYQQQFSLRGL